MRQIVKSVIVRNTQNFIFGGAIDEKNSFQKT
jgi:hypothetical protein